MLLYSQQLVLPFPNIQWVSCVWRAEGGAKIVGVFRVKNHDFTPKYHFSPNFRGARTGCPPPPGSAPALYLKDLLFVNLFSSWIQLKYCSLDVKQQSINQFPSKILQTQKDVRRFFLLFLNPLINVYWIILNVCVGTILYLKKPYSFFKTDAYAKHLHKLYRA